MGNKIVVLFVSCLAFFMPSALSAQEASGHKTDEIFKARVIDVVERKSVVRDDGSASTRQILKLEGLEGKRKNSIFIFDGTKFDVLSATEYEVGDKVLVNFSLGSEGEENYYVIGHSRNGALYFLGFLFAIVVIAVGRLKGFRALVVLLATFIIILKFMIPRILAGGDPLSTSIIGSLYILILAVYVTEGLKRTSTIAVFSITITLVITGLLSVWFSAVARLTGFASEEAMYLTELAGGNLNIKGLLLAGIIVGALGVLDDVIISQVSLVQELKAANPDSDKYQIYRQAMRIGVSHLSSMVNTLFLAYAGASLPLLILFSVKQPPFLSFNQVIDNEMMATEIVRTLTGSIGLVLAVPIATFLAVHFLKTRTIDTGR